ncbi:MAG TPA: tetratricopeptide repeat protein, partial [Thermoanaerobaculia bacterium]|nr:tetratricopeptide repeat protein [Thermoanaerobaculia bacterium]
EALELLYRALRLDPSLTAAWTNLGVALRRAGDATGAVMAYEMALRIDPSDAAARRDLALAGERQVP